MRFTILRRATARFVLVALLLLLATATWLWIGPPEVKSKAVPRSAALAPFLADADYADSYRMRASRALFPDAAALDLIAFQKGELVAEGEGQVVYRGTSPGLVFWIGYATLPQANGWTEVEVSTVVRYERWTGRLYFFFVRPIHRLGMPWLLRYQVKGASAATSPITLSTGPGSS